MTSFSARAIRGTGVHDTVHVYAGPDPDHRAHVGDLVMLRDEAEALLALLNGPALTEGDPDALADV